MTIFGLAGLIKVVGLIEKKALANGSDAIEKNSSDIAAEIRAAKNAIGSGRQAEAEAMMREVLRLEPRHEEALYTLAVSQRFQDKFRDALATLLDLRKLEPRIGRVLQEMAYVYRGLGDRAAMKAAFEGAVAIDPALLSSWKQLLEIYKEEGLHEAEERAAKHIETLSDLPAPLRSVASLINDGKLVKAEQLCRQYLQKHPQNVEGMRMLADVGVRLKVLDDAEFLLESAIEFEPDHLMARFDYASVLRQRQKFEKALVQIETLLEREPGNLGFKGLYANIYAAIGKHEEALEIYREMLPHAPARHQLLNSCGHALKTIGRVDEAVKSYRDAYAAKPDYGDAFWSLANLKTYRFTDEELLLAKKAERSQETSADDRCHLCFALGKSAEDAGQFEEAFSYYDKGNKIKRGQSNYSIERNNLETSLQQQICTRELFDKYKGSGHPAPDPIFIVGLPRAGSTLLEQILASHSQIDGTLELPNIITTAHKLNGRRKASEEPSYPAVLHDLPIEQFEKLGKYYIDDTRIHRGNAPYFVDKMPNNFRHIGLIHLLLPNAKIIDARRHPMGCCFSGFKQLFAEGQEFTYGLEEIGNYYRRYVELMDHWDKVLPGKVLRVQYEDVVADLECQVRRILAYCGLEFEEACISFHKTERAIRTPSAEQVRQPIYKAGVDHWRRFEAYLEPLKEALGPVLDRYPDTH